MIYAGVEEQKEQANREGRATVVSRQARLKFADGRAVVQAAGRSRTRRRSPGSVTTECETGDDCWRGPGRAEDHHEDLPPRIAAAILGAYHGVRACTASPEPGEAGIPDKLNGRERWTAPDDIFDLIEPVRGWLAATLLLTSHSICRPVGVRSRNRFSPTQSPPSGSSSRIPRSSGSGPRL